MSDSNSSVLVIEIRDPDGGIDTYVYVNGQEAEDFAVVEFDAGRGWERDDWNDWVDHNLATLPRAAAGKLRELNLREDPPGSEYITDY